MNKKLLLIISAALSVLFIAAHFFFGYCFRLDNIIAVGSSDAGSIFVNDDDSDITIFRMNGADINKATGRISFKKYFENDDNDWGYNYPLCIAENDGKFYLLNIKEYLSETPSEYEVRLLNFDKGRCEVMFSFTDEMIDEKIVKYFDYDETKISAYYDVIYQSFKVDDDGIVLCFRERKDDNENRVSTEKIYSGKFSGGELSSAEIFSEYENSDPLGTVIESTSVFENDVIDIDYNYRFWVNGKIIPELADVRCYNIVDYIDGNLVIMGIDGKLYKIDIAAKTMLPLDELSKKIENEGLRDSDLFRFYNDGSGMGVVFSDGERSCLLSSDFENKTDTVFVENVFELIVHSLIAVVIAFAVVWLTGLMIYTLKTHGKVSIKFVALAIPAILCCDLVTYGFISKGIYAVEEDVFKKNLNAVAEQQRLLGMTDGIGDFDLNGEYREQIDVYMQAYVNNMYLDLVYNSESKGAQTGIAYLGYMRESGGFVNVYDIIYQNTDLDMLSVYPSKTADKIAQAVKNHSNVYCRLYSEGFENISLISPTYFSGDGSVNGVYIYTISAAEVHRNTTALLGRLTVYNLILSTVIALLFTLFTFLLLRGLKKLQKKSTDYLSGEYVPALEDTGKHSGAINEIDVISEKFDELLDSVNKNFSEIDNLRKANTAYFSDAILKIFNKKTINSIKLGEYAEVEAYCIEALLPEDYADFDNMDSLLSELSEKLRDCDAFAADIDNSSLSVYSLNSEAVNILFFLREYDNRIIAAADKCVINMSFIKIGGSCRCQIKREDISRQEVLMNTLINTMSSTVVTESVADTRGEELSKICIGMVDNEFIYDISDGVQKRFENSIRDRLKSGIELYFSGNYVSAREMFVIILKKQQKNPVARYYINLIDESRHKEGALQ